MKGEIKISRNKYAGIDGCKNGWITAVLSKEKNYVKYYSAIEDACMDHQDCRRILADMPIGLAANEEESAMRPEALARKLLKKRASCVFNTPCKQAVYTDEYEAANMVNKEILHKGISKQSFYISAKIREVDIFLNEYPKFKNKLLESHPEICFAMLNEDRQPLMENKKTKVGSIKRIQLLAKYYPAVTKTLDEVERDAMLSVHLEDVIDALALAVTNYLIEERGLSTIPEKPVRNMDGLYMQMVYTRD